MQDEQLRLLGEALDWALTARSSAEARCASLSGDAGERPAAAAEELSAAHRKLQMTQETVDEIRGKMAARERSLSQSAPR